MKFTNTLLILALLSAIAISINLKKVEFNFFNNEKVKGLWNDVEGKAKEAAQKAYNENKEEFEQKLHNKTESVKEKGKKFIDEKLGGLLGNKGKNSTNSDHFNAKEIHDKFSNKTSNADSE